MNRILLVRTSSLGDMIHVLPVVSDIQRHFPGATIDWVAEEAFAEIPAWHPGVNEVIKVAHRRWRKNWWAPEVKAEREALHERLGRHHYDVVLDMQGMLKTVWVVRQTQGRRHGLDWKSAREPLASLFYDVKHRIEFWQPGVLRQRQLGAKAFGYGLEAAPDFGLARFSVKPELPASFVEAYEQREAPYAVIMPSASRAEKRWADANWHQVFAQLRRAGLQLRVVSGSQSEFEWAQSLVQGVEGVTVLPRMGLTAVAQLLAGARVMLGLDTGLTHLSAALGRPTIGIYTDSTPRRGGLVGTDYTASLGDKGLPPDYEAVRRAIEQAMGPAVSLPI